MGLYFANISSCVKMLALIVLGILLPVYFGGICYAEGFVKPFKGKSYTGYLVDLESDQLEILSRDNTGSRLRNAGDLKSFAEARGQRLVFATNAGIFDKSFVPVGLLVERGKQLVPLNTANGHGNFYMKPNGVFSIAGKKGSIVNTQVFDPQTKVDYASQSGPLLLDAGRINSSFDPNSKNKLIRSGVGVRDRSKVLFVISNEPVSFYELAVFFKSELECESALYLDGVISVMYASDLKREQTHGDFAALFAVFGDPDRN